MKLKMKYADYEKNRKIVKKNVSGLAEIMKVNVIHISELEQIEPNDLKKLEVYVTNTLCIDSFHDRWFVNVEVTMGSHD